MYINGGTANQTTIVTGSSEGRRDVVIGGPTINNNFNIVNNIMQVKSEKDASFIQDSPVACKDHTDEAVIHSIVVRNFHLSHLLYSKN